MQWCDNSFLEAFLTYFTYKVRQRNIFSKCDRQLLQSASGMTKCDRLLLQGVSYITKYDRLLLRNASGITKFGRLYYKVRQVLQGET